jgi:CRISPR-associated endonuclease Csn1
MDNSFTNKTLTERDFNFKKGNKTPYEFFNERPEVFKEFKERIKNFSSSKQKRFLLSEIPSDFLAQQLNNTAYIAREVRKNLRTICRNVRIPNGQATSALRRFWGLNQILNPDGLNEKSRDDHRHHAVDALIIANTSDGFIQLLSTASKFDYSGKMTIRNFPLPYENFNSEAKLLLQKVLVSFKNKKRLITSKTNKYNKKIGKNQKTISIRGALHEETLYGKILNPHTKEESYVIRKKLTDLDKMKQVSKIIDPSIRELVKNHIEENGGESKIKQALSVPLYMFSKNGKKKIPINKVRIAESSESLIQLRPNENPKLFVTPESNYLIAIYENEEKRDFETVSFYQAVKNKLEKKPLYPKEKSGIPFAFCIFSYAKRYGCYL